jgi:hypothetical protein
MAGDHRKARSGSSSVLRAKDNIFKYSNGQLTAMLKDKTPKEVISKFGFPDRISAKVTKNKKIVYYKYGKTYTNKDKGVVFVNDKVKEVTVCQ